MTVRFPTAEEQAAGLIEAPKEVKTPAKESLDSQKCVYCKQGQWTSRSGYTARLMFHYDSRQGGDCYSHNHCARRAGY